MSIKVLVNGAFGRMGLMTVSAINEHPDLELVGQTGREYDLKQSIKDSKADVVVDFTEAAAVYQNTMTILDAQARPVIGTSGLKSEEIKALQAHAATLNLGGIIAPNFSLGAVLMMKCAKEIARYMQRAEIIEYHHADKSDSPSGTALHSAQLLREGSETLNIPAIESHETIPHGRGATYFDVPIHSIRLPGVLAREDIIFGNVSETLTLSHNSIDRECFMPGVCFACVKVMTLNQMVYGLEEIL